MNCSVTACAVSVVGDGERRISVSTAINHLSEMRNHQKENHREVLLAIKQEDSLQSFPPLTVHFTAQRLFYIIAQTADLRVETVS